MATFFRGYIFVMMVMLTLTLKADQTNTLTYNNVNASIPDNDPSGTSTSGSVSGILGPIVSIQLTLDLVGTPTAFNGDYYIALSSSSGQGLAVLVNRVGVMTQGTTTNSVGYGDNGMQVTFSDTAAHDIHFYQNYSPSYNGYGQLTGTWQPDGEYLNPLGDPSQYDNAESDQTAMLSSFDGQSPDQTWTLYMADLSAGGTGELAGWSMTIVTAPEPATTALLAGGLMLLGLRWRKQQANWIKK